MVNNIGIMQGRLSKQHGEKIQEFPKNSWEEEFKIAKNIGFNVIEWVFDSKDNPILEDDKLNDIVEIIKKYGVLVNSIIADFFMDNSLTRGESEENFEILKKLIINAHKIGAKNIEIPFVDSSSLKTQDEIINLENILQKIVPTLEKYKMIIGLETDLNPKDFSELLKRINNSRIKANYDSGNSASLGYNMQEEFELLGHSIINIHVKDRIFGGTTVPLGTGDVDFDIFFKLIKKFGYKEDIIIQGARNEKELSEEICKKYLKFVKQYVDKYLN